MLQGCEKMTNEISCLFYQRTNIRTFFQLAMGIAGGVTSRINAIKEGIKKGFADIKKAFGDWLPDISSKTYDKAIEKLDHWVAKTTAVA